jgi:polyhydroxyalkanoate synthesis regulator protein
MFKGHLIKRYGNRKLYSITESRYVTLPEIGEKFLDGSGFIIKDLKTDEDLTVQYLVKALVSVGHFNEQIKVKNLGNIETNLQERRITVHG